jgi:hypothetical protein
MSTDQARTFNAATNVLAYAQAFTSASVRDDEAVRPRKAGRRAPAILRLRRHRTGR